MSNYIRAASVLLLVIVGLGCTNLPGRTLDIAQIDLLSLKGWNSTEVSVDGLRLGMTLDDAAVALSARGLKLFDMDTRTPCAVISRFCNVSKEATHDGRAVTVQLGKGARIVMIDVGVSEDPAKLVDTLAGRFKGTTRQFFFHYSDELRSKLLGAPDRVEKSATTDAIQAQKYTYDRLGLVVYTNRYLRQGMKHPSAPELSSIEFVMPKSLQPRNR